MTELFDKPASSYCTMKVGGKIKRICFPENKDELKSIIADCSASGEKHIILGNASNVIFPDETYEGTVIFTKNCKALSNDGNRVTAECGVTMNALSTYACSLSLSGLEFAFGVPGTVGGGVFMNAGCYGGEIADTFAEGEFLDRDGNTVTLYKDQMMFSHRHSVLCENGYILLSASFELTPGDTQTMNGIMSGNMAKRREKQPLEYPSCGSFFKRPVGNYAGTLIDQCGLKGLTVGGACVSEKHAGFIINKGGATAADIRALAEIVHDTVKEKTGVELEREVIFLEQ